MQLFTPLTLAMLVANQAAAFIASQGATIHSPGCHCNCNTCATSTTSLSSLQKYADELKETAKTLCRPGQGLLACDESTGTVGSRLESIGLDNIEDNRRDVRFVLNITSFVCSASNALFFPLTLLPKTVA